MWDHQERHRGLGTHTIATGWAGGNSYPLAPRPLLCTPMSSGVGGVPSLEGLLGLLFDRAMGGPGSVPLCHKAVGRVIIACGRLAGPGTLGALLEWASCLALRRGQHLLALMMDERLESAAEANPPEGWTMAPGRAGAAERASFSWRSPRGWALDPGGWKAGGRGPRGGWAREPPAKTGTGRQPLLGAPQGGRRRGPGPRGRLGGRLGPTPPRRGRLPPPHRYFRIGIERLGAGGGGEALSPRERPPGCPGGRPGAPWSRNGLGEYPIQTARCTRPRGRGGRGPCRDVNLSPWMDQVGISGRHLVALGLIDLMEAATKGWASLQQVNPSGDLRWRFLSRGVTG